MVVYSVNRSIVVLKSYDHTLEMKLNKVLAFFLVLAILHLQH